LRRLRRQLIGFEGAMDTLQGRTIKIDGSVRKGIEKLSEALVSADK
jgi:hypothetical protein